MAAPMSTERRREPLPVEAPLQRVTLLFRSLGWLWMLILVVVALAADDVERPAVALAAMFVATVWTGVTYWAAGSGNLGRIWFVLADGAVALAIGAASTLADANDLFHGGYPLSWIAVAAYGGGIRWALPASFVLAAEQVVVHAVDGRGVVAATGSLVFVVTAIILGWAFDSLRKLDRALDTEQRARVRFEERVELANRLHDSVLQTLIALRREADDPRQVRYLARRQERQLRATISEYRSPFDPSVRVELQRICDEVEDVHQVEIDAVIRGDAPCSDEARSILGGASEALINAAKHAEVGRVDLYAELEEDYIELFVRDRGHGFDPAALSGGRGLQHSLQERVVAVGGTVHIASEVGAGTEVAIAWRAQ